MPGILFVSGWYPTDEDPSYGIFVRRHALAASLSNKVSVLYVHTIESDSRKIMSIKTSEKDNLLEIKISINKNRLVLGAPEKAYYFAKALIAGYYMVKKHSGKPGLVHANILYEGGRQALLLKLFFGIPFVCAEHWTGYQPEDGSYRGFFREMISKRVAKKSRFVLPVTQHLADAMQAHKLDGKYKVVPNTVDTKKFNPESRRENSSRLIHISSLDERQKNFSGIVDAFKIIAGDHPELKLVVAGGANHIPTSKEMVARAGIDKEKIIFTGNKTETEIAQLLSESAALVLFSNYENQPCVIIESLASGTPVIATDVGGVSEIVNDRNGILVKAKDKSALVNAMRSVLEKKNTFVPEQLAKTIKEQYGYEAVGNRLSEIYKSALS